MSNGKGSKPRPLSVAYENYANNYDSIFRKKPTVKKSNKKKLTPSIKEAEKRWAKKIPNEEPSNRGYGGGKFFRMVNEEATGKIQLTKECKDCGGTGIFSEGIDKFDCTNCNGRGTI